MEAKPQSEFRLRHGNRAETTLRLVALQRANQLASHSIRLPNLTRAERPRELPGLFAGRLSARRGGQGRRQKRRLARRTMYTRRRTRSPSVCSACPRMSSCAYAAARALCGRWLSSDSVPERWPGHREAYSPRQRLPLSGLRGSRRVGDPCALDSHSRLSPAGRMKVRRHMPQSQTFEHSILDESNASDSCTKPEISHRGSECVLAEHVGVERPCG